VDASASMRGNMDNVEMGTMYFSHKGEKMSLPLKRFTLSTTLGQLVCLGNLEPKSISVGYFAEDTIFFPDIENPDNAVSIMDGVFNRLISTSFSAFSMSEGITKEEISRKFPSSISKKLESISGNPRNGNMKGIGARLDLALKDLEDSQFFSKTGTKMVFIFTDGSPEMGNVDARQDAVLQMNVIDKLTRHANDAFFMMGFISPETVAYDKKKICILKRRMDEDKMIKIFRNKVLVEHFMDSRKLFGLGILDKKLWKDIDYFKLASESTLSLTDNEKTIPETFWRLWKEYLTYEVHYNEKVSNTRKKEKAYDRITLENGGDPRSFVPFNNKESKNKVYIIPNKTFPSQFYDMLGLKYTMWDIMDSEDYINRLRKLNVFSVNIVPDVVGTNEVEIEKTFKDFFGRLAEMMDRAIKEGKK
ncbi:MAG: hypothetical protein ACTSRU_20200, partial [Candidatus Hodarchaeales archaeon]